MERYVMSDKIFRIYRFKFYLNASHHVVFNGKEGETHPHTWEFTLEILIRREENQQFSVYEKAVEDFFAPYQNQTMNDTPPFDTLLPTLENMVEWFGEHLRPVVREVGGTLLQFEGSETPTRSYLVQYSADDETLASVRKDGDKVLGQAFDTLLDSM